MRLTASWATPRRATPEEKTRSLALGLLWTYGIIQGCFLAYVISIYVRAEQAENGDPFNDLGVAIGREVALNDAYGTWGMTAVFLGAVFAGIYFALRAKWRK